jgi:hypothetical protein
MENRDTEIQEGTKIGKAGIPITTSTRNKRLQSWYFIEKLH